MRTRLRAVVAKVEEKGKGNKGSRDTLACATGEDAVATETVIQQLRSKPRWRMAHLKCICPKGDSCPFPYIDEYSVARIKFAEKRQKDLHKHKVLIEVLSAVVHRRATRRAQYGEKAAPVRNEFLPWFVGAAGIL